MCLYCMGVGSFCQAVDVGAAGQLFDSGHGKREEVSREGAGDSQKGYGGLIWLLTVREDWGESRDKGTKEGSLGALAAV